MKQILILTDEYPPKLGGAGVVAMTYLNFLKDEYDVTLSTTNSMSIDVNYSFQKKSIIWPIQYWWHFKKLKLDRYDAIILNDGPVQFSASLFFSAHLLSKSIVIIHGVETLLLEPTLLSKLFRYKNRIEAVYNKARTVIGVSKYILNQVAKYFDIYQASKTVIYTPSLIEHANVVRVDHKLLSVGRIEESKGFSRMYDVFKCLIASDARWTWTVIGDGSYLQELKNKATKDGTVGSIHFLGHVDHHDLSTYYSSHSVFLLLSEYMEALGLVYLEAIACDLPVVTYDRFGPAEVVESVEICIGVEFDSSIKCIVDSILFANNLSAKAINQFDSVFSKERFMTDIRSILNEY